jgi:hypothetical protein
MRKDYTHLIILLDKSGSMACLASDTIGGVNRLVAEQKALPGNFTSSIYQFNTGVTEVQAFTQLTKENYKPAGGTALLDAICTAIDREGVELAALPEANRPDKVVVLIVTDGQENASTKFKREDVVSRKKTQSEVYKWEFVFLGANIDAFAEASALGINAVNTYQWNNTPESIKASYCDTSKSLGAYRVGATQTVDMSNPTK